VFLVFVNMNTQRLRRTEDYIFTTGKPVNTKRPADDLISYTYRGALDGRSYLKQKSKSQRPNPQSTLYTTKTYWVNSHAQTSNNFQSAQSTAKQYSKANHMGSTSMENPDGFRTNSELMQDEVIKIETYSRVSPGSTGPFTQHLKNTQFMSTANTTSLPSVKSAPSSKQDAQPLDDGISALYNVEQWMDMKKMRKFVCKPTRQSYEDR
jgi:hypothetical protein